MLFIKNNQDFLSFKFEKFPKKIHLVNLLKNLIIS